MTAHADKAHQKLKRSIVLVEDNADLRSLTALMLEGSGFDVTTFEDGASALDKLSKDRSSVYALLTDFEMPRMDGVALIRALHKKQIKIPITVLISGSYNASSAVQTLENEVSVEFLEKPYLPKDLLILLQGEE